MQPCIDSSAINSHNFNPKNNKPHKQQLVGIPHKPASSKQLTCIWHAPQFHDRHVAQSNPCQRQHTINIGRQQIPHVGTCDILLCQGDYCLHKYRASKTPLAHMNSLSTTYNHWSTSTVGSMRLRHPCRIKLPCCLPTETAHAPVYKWQRPLLCCSTLQPAFWLLLSSRKPSEPAHGCNDKGRQHSPSVTMTKGYLGML